MYRNDVLAFAYECCQANGGAAGVDGQTFEDIEACGPERWLDELAQELKSRTYQPPSCATGLHTQAGRETVAAKSTAIRDRTAEMGAEPIFEADPKP